MEKNILALYSCGMSQRNIAGQIKELFDMEISSELVTKLSEKIMPEVTAWQNRPLEEHRCMTQAAYVVLGITMDGRKDIWGV